MEPEKLSFLTKKLCKWPLEYLVNLCKFAFDLFEKYILPRQVWRQHQDEPVHVNTLRRRLRGLFLCWLGNHHTCRISKNSNCPGLLHVFFRIVFWTIQPIWMKLWGCIELNSGQTVETGSGQKWKKSWFWWFNTISDNNKQSDNAKSIPFIQKFGKIRIRDARNPSRKREIEIRISKYLFPALMSNWLLSYKFCDAFLNSKSASIIEALNSSCEWKWA